MRASPLWCGATAFRPRRTTSVPRVPDAARGRRTRTAASASSGTRVVDSWPGLQPSSPRTTLPTVLQPLVQSCHWTGSVLVVGTYGFVAALDLDRATATLLALDSELAFNRHASGSSAPPPRDSSRSARRTRATRTTSSRPTRSRCRPSRPGAPRAALSRCVTTASCSRSRGAPPVPGWRPWRRALC